MDALFRLERKTPQKIEFGDRKIDTPFCSVYESNGEKSLDSGHPQFSHIRYESGDIACKWDEFLIKICARTIVGERIARHLPLSAPMFGVGTICSEGPWTAFIHSCIYSARSEVWTAVDEATVRLNDESDRPTRSQPGGPEVCNVNKSQDELQRIKLMQTVHWIYASVEWEQKSESIVVGRYDTRVSETVLTNKNFARVLGLVKARGYRDIVKVRVELSAVGLADGETTYDMKKRQQGWHGMDMAS